MRFYEIKSMICACIDIFRICKDMKGAVWGQCRLPREMRGTNGDKPRESADMTDVTFKTKLGYPWEDPRKGGAKLR